MIIVKIITYIFFNLLILNTWIYISNKIFGNSITNNQKTINILTIGLLSAGCLFAINNYTKIIDINNIYKLNPIYILIIFIIPIIHFLINKIKLSNILSLIINILIFLIIVFIVNMTDVSDKILYYYVLVGLTEEFIKYNLANNTYISYGKLKSDILLFGIISGIGFGLIENVIYIYHYITGIQLLNFGVFTISRGIFGFLIHIVFSGLFCLIIYIFYEKKSEYSGYIKNINYKYILYYIFGIILIGISHGLYDIYITKYIAIVGTITALIGYILISYLFFISDRWYYEQNNKHIK